MTAAMASHRHLPRRQRLHVLLSSGSASALAGTKLSASNQADPLPVLHVMLHEDKVCSHGSHRVTQPGLQP